MSSSDRPSGMPTRLWRRLGLGVVLAMTLSACVQPLYGPQTRAATGTGSVREVLARIEVAPLPDRTGHTLRNELAFLLDGREPVAGGKTHRLNVAFTEIVTAATVSSALQRGDAATLQINASYQVVPIAGGPPIAIGTATAQATYERQAQRFATLRAQQDARKRAALSMAELIHADIAAQLARKP